MLDMPTGQLIKLYRIDRKKSTTNVATLAGITVRYLEMIEAGTKTPTLHVLRRIAKVLSVRTSALLGESPSEDHEGPVNPHLAKMERALFTYGSVPLESAVNEENLAERIDAIATAWYTSHNAHSEVLSALPGLIVETESYLRESGRNQESCRVAYSLYRLTRGVLKHVGRIDLCAMAAERTMRYAEETEDPLTLAAASWTLGQAILSDDMPHGALDVALMSADKMEPLLSEGTLEHLSIYGSLIQCAAIAAGRIGDPWQAKDLLRDKAVSWNDQRTIGSSQPRSHSSTPSTAPVGWVFLQRPHKEGITIRWRRGEATADVLEGKRVGSHGTHGLLDQVSVATAGWTDLTEIRQLGQRWLRWLRSS